MPPAAALPRQVRRGTHTELQKRPLAATPPALEDDAVIMPTDWEMVWTPLTGMILGISQHL